jgi:predicted outer membrane repeat protein
MRFIILNILIFGFLFIPISTFALTIQERIDDAENGETILLAAATYSGPGNWDLDFKGKEIRLLGTQPSDVIIDCEGDHRGFIFQTNEGRGAIVQNIRIINGSADNGGAIKCMSGTSPTIIGCEFGEPYEEGFGCNASNRGGAIYCAGGSSPKIEGCIFYNNTATNHGGAVCCNYSSPVIYGCWFQKNMANQGGGLATLGLAAPIVVECAFEENWAQLGCGAYSDSDAIPTYIHNEFFDNSQIPVPGKTLITHSSSTKGGGIYCYSATIDSCIFTGNSAHLGGGIYSHAATLDSCQFFNNSAVLGGGIYTESSTVDSCYFSGNRADSLGGAVYCYTVSNTATFNNCTFAGDSAGYRGGIMACDNSDVEITGCVFYSGFSGNTGGGLDFYQTDATLADCEIDECEASKGGGVAVREGSEVSLINTTLTYCTAVDFGGGVDSKGGSNTTLTDCTIDYCSATKGGGIALRQANTTVVMDTCLISNCSAGNWGGGAECNSGAWGSLNQCTLFGCSAANGGAVAVRQADSRVLMNGSVISNSTSGGAVRCDEGGYAGLGCCDVHGNVGGDYDDCISDQQGVSGNFSQNPYFCNPEEGDYSLQLCSPLGEGHGCGQIGPYGEGCECSFEVPTLSQWGIICLLLFMFGAGFFIVHMHRRRIKIN